jgi:hypothetical protein
MDSNLKLTFHDDQLLITISTHEKDTVLQCKSFSERDGWVSALYSASRHEVEDEDEDEDDNDEEKLLTNDQVTSDDSNDAESMNEYNEDLLAFQDVRSSILKCSMTLLGGSDQYVATKTSPLLKSFHLKRDHAQTTSTSKNETEMRVRYLNSLLTYIETSPHGGRSVLLQLNLIQPLGIHLVDLVRALGEKQKENPRRASFTNAAMSMQKLYIATFIRDILFHPLYSKHPAILEANQELNRIIYQFFPHCRLRRFSQDADHMIMIHPISPELMKHVAKPDDTQQGVSNPVKTSSGNTTTTSQLHQLLLTRRKRHSFPNIFVPLVASASNSSYSSGNNTPTGSATSTSESTQQEQQDLTSLTSWIKKKTNMTASQEILDAQQPLQKQQLYPSLQEQSSSKTMTILSGNDSDLLVRDVTLLDPLRNLLWKFSCTEIAEQITFFHAQQLKKQLILWEFIRHPTDSTKAISDHFNRLVMYFVWSVLVEDTPKERAEVIENIIDIALAALTPSLHNFHLVMACVGCLGDLPLMASRLPNTWKKVRSKYRTRLRDLRLLCDHTGGFEMLRKRQATESMKGPSIPFVGVIGVTMERLRSMQHFSNASNSKLDIDKMERQYVALNAIENALQKPFKQLEPNARLQSFIHHLNMEFATPKLFQLRSQQILGLETVNASSSGSRHSSFSPGNLLSPSEETGTIGTDRSSIYGSSTLHLITTLGNSASSTTESMNGVNGGSIPSNGDHPGFLPFRSICAILASVKDHRERVSICLEALFADDRQAKTKYLHKFWLEFKQNASLSACHVTLSGIRVCTDAIVKSLLNQKCYELLELSGLDENSTELIYLVYEKVVRIVVQPIMAWIFAKVKRTFETEDVQLRNAMNQMKNANSMPLIHEESTAVLGLLHMFESLGTPMEMTNHLAQMNAFLGGENASMETKIDMLLPIMIRSNLQSPFSTLHLMQQLLDLSLISSMSRDGFQLFEAVISRLDLMTFDGTDSRRSSLRKSVLFQMQLRDKATANSTAPCEVEDATTINTKQAEVIVPVSVSRVVSVVVE